MKASSLDTWTKVQPTFEAQRSYWNDRWGKGPLPNAWQLRRGAAILDLIRELGLTAPRIMDCGCGTGWFTAQLATIGTATGVDLSEWAIAEARRRYSAPTFLVDNFFEQTVPEHEFDLVVSQEVIAHVVEPRGYVARISRMLRPGGFLILTTANPTVINRIDHPADPDSHIKNWLTLKDLRALLNAHGLPILKHTTVIPRGDQGFLQVVNSHKLNALLTSLITEERVTQLKERAGWGYSLVLLAQRRRSGTPDLSLKAAPRGGNLRSEVD